MPTLPPPRPQSLTTDYHALSTATQPEETPGGALQPQHCCVLQCIAGTEKVGAEEEQELQPHLVGENDAIGGGGVGGGLHHRAMALPDSFARIFPTPGSAVVFFAYMAMFVAQGMLVTASRHGAQSYSYNTVTVVLLTECLKLLLSSLAYLTQYV